MSDRLKVKLTYFKRSGKYYTEGEFETDNKPIYQIWEEIIVKKNEGSLLKPIYGGLPGVLTNGYIISVDVPDHEHNHPHLIL